MILADAAQLLIEERKIVDYLLNPGHPDNGGKAALFTGWGFALSDWRTFAKAVREMVACSQVADRIQSPWGEKYLVDGSLAAPHGMTPPVRTVWIADGSATVVRLVTAYPRE